MGNPPFLPITAKLWQLNNWRNVAYLAQAAVFTRLLTGVVRVMENAPSKNHDPRLTPNQKRQTLIERSFVELVGTTIYMACLHIGQDMISKVYEKGGFGGIRLPQMKESERTPHQVAFLDKYNTDVAKFNDLVEKVYRLKAAGSAPQKAVNAAGLINRVLYGEQVGEKYERATLSTLQKHLVEHIQQVKTVKPTEMAAVKQDAKKFLEGFGALQKFARANNLVASLGILTGVLLSALAGGSFIQWANDRKVAPWAKKMLEKKYGTQPEAPHVKVAQAHPAPALNVTSAAPGVVSPAFSAHALNGPVYLPNPKIQSPASGFAASALGAAYARPLIPSPGVGGLR